MQTVHRVQGTKAMKYTVNLYSCLFLSITLHYADFPIREAHLYQDAEHCA